MFNVKIILPKYGLIEVRNSWRLVGKGVGIHWETIDEDISTEGLIAGRPSGESQASFKKRLESGNQIH